MVLMGLDAVVVVAVMTAENRSEGEVVAAAVVRSEVMTPMNPWETEDREADEESGVEKAVVMVTTGTEEATVTTETTVIADVEKPEEVAYAVTVKTAGIEATPPEVVTPSSAYIVTVVVAISAAATSKFPMNFVSHLFIRVEIYLPTLKQHLNDAKGHNEDLFDGRHRTTAVIELDKHLNHHVYALMEEMMTDPSRLGAFKKVRLLRTLNQTWIYAPDYSRSSNSKDYLHSVT